MRGDYQTIVRGDYATKVQEREQAERRAAIAALDAAVEELHYRLDVARAEVERAEAKRAELGRRLDGLVARWDGDGFQDVSPRFSDAVSECGSAWAAVTNAEQQLQRLEQQRAALADSLAGVAA